MSLYAGYKGRAILVGPDGTNYNLYLTKYVLTSKTPEEDATVAVATVALACRNFIAATISRIDVSLEGFWSKNNNPFGAASNPLLIGFNYVFKLYFDKNAAINVNTLLLITGCEIQSSVRDVVRYTVTGVINGPIVPSSQEGFPRFFPLN